MGTRTHSTAAAMLLVTSLTASALVGTTTAGAATQRPVPATSPSAPSARVAPVVVDIGVGRHSVTRSRTGFRPGNTVFNVHSIGGRGSIEVLRFKRGYTLRMFRRDAGGLFSGDVTAIRRVDRKVVFYGGATLDGQGPQRFGTMINAGRYLIVNLDKQVFTRMRVEGRRQARSLPRPTAVVNMVGEDRFSTADAMPRSGWMRQSNKTDEPHFMDLNKVKETTTPRKVRRYFASGAEGEPPWALRDHAGTMIISPGHTVVWKYDLSHGKYLEMCFWPSDEDGTPHAFMGMWHLTHLY